MYSYHTCRHLNPWLLYDGPPNNPHEVFSSFSCLEDSLVFSLSLRSTIILILYIVLGLGVPTQKVSLLSGVAHLNYISNLLLIFSMSNLFTHLVIPLKREHYPLKLQPCPNIKDQPFSRIL